MIPQVRPSLALAAGILALVHVADAGFVANRDLHFPVHVARRGPNCYSSSSPATTTTTATKTPRPTPTGIPSGPDPDEDCYRPSPFEQNIDYDELCKCSYYDPESGEPGNVRCWVTCNAYKPEQTKIVPENDKLSSCINACSGSFEKAKRAVEAGVDVSKRQDEYWFCHAVNFIEGELCEFVGDIGGYTYSPWGASCWLYPGLGTG